MGMLPAKAPGRMRRKEWACLSRDRRFAWRDSCGDPGGKWQGEELPQLSCLEHVRQMSFPARSY